MAREIVHFVGYEAGAKLPVGDVVKHVHTRCGRTITRPLVEGDPVRYTMVAQNGNVFHCTTKHEEVSCIKCNIALGNTQ